MCRCQLPVKTMCIRQLSVKFSVICQLSGKCECVLIIKKEPSMAWNSPSWALLWRIQSNLSTTAILDTNKSGRWRNVAVIFLQGCNIVLKREMPVLTFKHKTFLKHIKKQMPNTNRDQQRAVQIKFVIFYNKNGQALCIHYSSVID